MMAGRGVAWARQPLPLQQPVHASVGRPAGGSAGGSVRGSPPQQRFPPLQQRRPSASASEALPGSHPGAAAAAAAAPAAVADGKLGGGRPIGQQPARPRGPARRRRKPKASLLDTLLPPVSRAVPPKGILVCTAALKHSILIFCGTSSNAQDTGSRRSRRSAARGLGTRQRTDKGASRRWHAVRATQPRRKRRLRLRPWLKPVPAVAWGMRLPGPTAVPPPRLPCSGFTMRRVLSRVSCLHRDVAFSARFARSLLLITCVAAGDDAPRTKASASCSRMLSHAAHRAPRHRAAGRPSLQRPQRSRGANGGSHDDRAGGGGSQPPAPDGRDCDGDGAGCGAGVDDEDAAWDSLNGLVERQRCRPVLNPALAPGAASLASIAASQMTDAFAGAWGLGFRARGSVDNSGPP